MPLPPPPTKHRRGPAYAVGLLVATPVHLVSLALLALGGLLIVRGDGWWQWLMGALVLGVAWLVRPRLAGEIDPHSVLVTPASAPTLTALVAEIAERLGTTPPTQVRVDSQLNAYVAPVGLRGRQLVIGAPYWMALDPQARVALLGHEVGHLAHGDLISGRYGGAAHRTLVEWVRLLDPDGSATAAGDPSPVARMLMAPPRWLVLGYLRLLVVLNATAGRQMELHADLAAATMGGTAGAVSCLETSLLAEGIAVELNRASIDPARPHLGEAVAARVAGYGDAQRAAARRSAATDQRRTDDSHPPTADRLRLIESAEPSGAAVVLDAARNRRIDQELAPALDQAFKRLGEAYRHSW